MRDSSKRRRSKKTVPVRNTSTQGELRKRFDRLNRYDKSIKQSTNNISRLRDSWELETEENRRKDKLKNMQKEAERLVMGYLSALAMIKQCKEDLPRVVTENLALERDRVRKEYDRNDVWCQDRFLQIDRKVAAFCTHNFANEDEKKYPIVWKISSIDAKGELFTVYDVDNSGKRELFARKALIALPTLEQAPLSVRKIFAQGEDVQAIFPGCTMFYPATVTLPPRASQPDFDINGGNYTNRAFQYQLVFHGDNGQEQWIEAQNVIPINKLRKV